MIAPHQLAVGDRIDGIVGAELVAGATSEPADVTLDDAHIGSVTARPERAASAPSDGCLDAGGLVLAPGFVDLQCNGAGGTDLTDGVLHDEGAIGHVAAVLPRFGVTTFLPTIVTSGRSVRDAACASLRDARRRTDATDSTGADPLGLHFEGPTISADHLGTHRGDLVATPTIDEIDRWPDGGVAMVTLAPEVEGALEITERLTRSGVVVSAGHTAMSPDDLAAARRAGICAVTHLFNAMAPFSHRRPGPIGAVLGGAGDAEDLAPITVGLVCDGIHVDPFVVAMTWRTLGPSRIALVSDAAAPLGGPFGTFRLGGVEVRYDESGVRTADGTLAGSTLALDEAVRNLVSFTGCSLPEAVATVTSTPADLLGLTDRGRIVPGARADLTLLTTSGDLVATVIGGRIAWKS